MTTTAIKRAQQIQPLWKSLRRKLRRNLSSLQIAAPGIARRLINEERHWLWLIIPFLIIAIPALNWAGSSWRMADYALILQPLTPFMAAALIWQQRLPIHDMYAELAFIYPADSPKRRGKLWPVLAGCALMALACLATAATIGPIALVIIAVSIFYYLYGPFLTRLIWIPLALLFTMVPPPTSVLQLMTRALEQGGAVVVGQAIHRIVPGSTGRTGMIILPNFQMPVSAALCGINVIFPSLQLVLWYCVFRRIRAGQAVILMVAAAGFSALLNVARVSFIALIGSQNGAAADAMRSDGAAMVGSIFLVALTCVMIYYLARIIGSLRFHRVSEFEADLREATMGPTLAEAISAAPRAAPVKAADKSEEEA